ncbi:hypothetical protein FB451DRAFT_1420346 [Mycena latifolia]|nr:hypothetical protein FB451DRAFT_1420346 [Mycena latifolia]
MSESHHPPDPVERPLTGPVNKARKKSDLVEIAGALGLDTTGIVDVLLARITTHLAANTETLSALPRFAGLYSFKTARKAPKKPVKTSADKAAEDDSEKAKSSTLTASDRKLKDLNITTDPPASFTPLSLNKTLREAQI